MKTSSAKAKGRRLQQKVRDDLRAVAGSRLDPTDVESTPMGVNGVDVILTKAARDLFGPLAIECKNVEKLNAIGVFQGHADKYIPQGKIPVMVHSRNHTEPRVTLLWSDFVRLYLSKALPPSPGMLRPEYDGISAGDNFCKHTCGLVNGYCSDCNRQVAAAQDPKFDALTEWDAERPRDNRFHDPRVDPDKGKA